MREHIAIRTTLRWNGKYSYKTIKLAKILFDILTQIAKKKRVEKRREAVKTYQYYKREDTV